MLARGGDVAAVVLPEDEYAVWGLGWRGAAQALLLNLGLHQAVRSVRSALAGGAARPWVRGGGSRVGST